MKANRVKANRVASTRPLHGRIARIWSARIHRSLSIATRIIHDRSTAIAAGIVILYVLVAILAPVLAPSDPFSGDASFRLQSPSLAHPFGTDELGRDILSRIIYGASMSLRIQLATVVTSLLLGTCLGLIAGYQGGWVDEVITRAMDVLLAFPGIFLSIAIIAAIGRGAASVVVAVGIALVPSFARLVRSSAMTCREQEYVEAARALGAGHGRLICRHIFPNCLTPLIVFTTVNLSVVLLTASGLSYLGLGVQPPEPEWGAMLSNSRTYLLTAPHATVIPGLAIMVVSLSLNVLGDGLRDALDPRARLKH